MTTVLSANSEPSPQMFTAEARDVARSLHGWIRFAAIVMRLSGLLTLAAAVGGAAALAAQLPVHRMAIAGIGTTYAVIGLAMMGMGFLLIRYSDRLLIAANQRRGAALLDAVPYETGYWWLAALFSVASLLSLVLVAGAPDVRRDALAAAGPPASSGQRPITDEDIEAEGRMMINLFTAGFSLAGAALIIVALLPPRTLSSE